MSSIQLRLLEKYPSPSAALIERARFEAQDLFEVKVDIIREMAGLHPSGDWMGRGARALDSPYTATGESSFLKLQKMLADLRTRNLQSETLVGRKSPLTGG